MLRDEYEDAGYRHRGKSNDRTRLMPHLIVKKAVKEHAIK